MSTLINYDLSCFQRGFIIPVTNFHLPREEWHEDEEGEGHHEGDDSHVDSDLAHRQLELLSKMIKEGPFTYDMFFHFGRSSSHLHSCNLAIL